MSPLKKMVAATTWFVGTKTVKQSSAGSAWVHGNPTGQPGMYIYVGTSFISSNQVQMVMPCHNLNANQTSAVLISVRRHEKPKTDRMAVMIFDVSGTTAIATMKMMQRQLEMLKR